MSGRLHIDNAKLYGEDFRNAMNELYSLANIKSTSTLVKQLELQHGPFQVGKFNRYLLGRNARFSTFDFDQFEGDFGLIPSHLRQRVSDVMRANFNSASPLPVYTKVSENVDASHDVIIRPFVHNDQTYIGILYLCPSTETPR
jgi:hypothetical protein